MRLFATSSRWEGHEQATGPAPAIKPDATLGEKSEGDVGGHAHPVNRLRLALRPESSTDQRCVFLCNCIPTVGDAARYHSEQPRVLNLNIALTGPMKPIDAAAVSWRTRAMRLRTMRDTTLSS